MTAAQAELEAQFLELRRLGGDVTATAEAVAHLRMLATLHSIAANANPQALRALEGKVNTTVSASSNSLRQLQQAISAAVLESSHLSAASAHLRDEVAGLRADLFDRRIFDRYLTFASPEEEEAYRRREAEARAYIDRQLAANTPEGNLNAAGATMDRMLDAHAHGAGNSPEFLPRWNRLVTATRKMREELRSDGRSSEEFDRNLRESVRRYLRSKGLSDAEIEARLAGAADPLEAVKPYLKTDQDAKALDRAVRSRDFGMFVPQTAVHAEVVIGADLPNEDAASVTAKQAGHETGLADVMAQFQAAGIASTPGQTPAGHGIAASTTTTNEPPVVRR